MRKKATLKGTELLIQTSHFELQKGETLLSSLDVEQLQELASLYKAEFQQLQDNKKTTELMLERVFKPAKYPDFHFHLDVLHELWIKGVIA